MVFNLNFLILICFPAGFHYYLLWLIFKTTLPSRPLQTDIAFSWEHGWHLAIKELCMQLGIIPSFYIHCYFPLSTYPFSYTNRAYIHAKHKAKMILCLPVLKYLTGHISLESISVCKNTLRSMKALFYYKQTVQVQRLNRGFHNISNKVTG